MSTLAKVWVFHLSSGEKVRFEFILPVSGEAALINLIRAGYSKADIASIESDDAGNCHNCGAKRMALCYKG